MGGPGSGRKPSGHRRGQSNNVIRYKKDSDRKGGLVAKLPSRQEFGMAFKDRKSMKGTFKKGVKFRRAK